MKICQNCTKSFIIGKNDCCSTDCNLENQQFKLDACFRDMPTHTQLLS